jgi:hypothetical protein
MKRWMEEGLDIAVFVGFLSVVLGFVGALVFFFIALWRVF